MRHRTVVIGTIFIISTGLVSLGLFAMTANALSFLPTISNPNVILLPFGKSVIIPNLSVPSIHFPFPNYHGTIPSNQQPQSRTPVAPSDIQIAALLRAFFPDQQAIVNMYKQYLDSNDYVFGARGDLNNANLLPGSKVAAWDNLAQIKENAPTLKSLGISVLGYDLEKALSPPSELTKYVTSMDTASNVAHKNGLQFAAIPGFPLIDPGHVSKIAPFADFFVIQAQGWERIHSGSNSCQQHVKDISSAIRAANPNVRIIAQLSLTQGTVNDMEQCTSAFSGMVDGIEANYGLTLDQVPLLNQFFSWLTTSH